MARNRTSDEQALASAFQQLADVLVPLKQELRVRAHAMVGAFLGVASSDAAPVEAPPSKPAKRQSASAGRQSPAPARQSAAPARQSAAPAPAAASGKAPSPKEFLAQKQPSTATEHVACLAYYLTHYRDMPQFKAADVSAINTEAGQRKFDNGTYSVNNATQAGYLVAVSRGMKQLAPAGQKYVDALPDRAAAKAGFRKRKSGRQRRQGSAG